MSSDPAARLARLLGSVTVTDHEEVLASATAALKISKADATAQQARIVALLKLDRFDDALRALAEGGTPLEEKCALEKAYALYKTGQLVAASELLRDYVSKASPERSYMHLAAQVAYRDDRFREAADIYTALQSQPVSDVGEKSDLLINRLAVSAQLEWQSPGAKPDPPARNEGEVSDGFEAVFNAACLELARNKIDSAASLLNRAIELCESSEDLSEDEKQAEKLPILIQLVYAYTLLGRLQEAIDVQKTIALSGAIDVPTKIVAEMNSLALQSDSANPFLAQRIAASLPVPPVTDRLFEHQTTALERNRYAMGIQTQKPNGVKVAISKRLAQESKSSSAKDRAKLSVLYAAAECQNLTGKEAVKHLVQLLEKKQNDIGLLLAVLQLYITDGSHGAALAVLESFLKRAEETPVESGEVPSQYMPGLVALAVALYREQGYQSAIRRHLSKAASYWRDRPGDPSARSLLREAGIELLRSSDPQDLEMASAAFKSLCEGSRDDDVAEAGLVASVAATDYAQAEPHLVSLRAVESLASKVDVAALLDAGVATLALPSGKDKKRTTVEDIQKPAKKRRLRKLPKDYEEGKVMDPERWLPLRDRSSYKPKGKKGKKRAQEATQGGPVKEEETIELVGGAGAVKVERASGGASKKKKKGKR